MKDRHLPRFRLLLAVSCVLLATGHLWGVPPAPHKQVPERPRKLGYLHPRKKLIEFGWDTAFMQLNFLRDNIRRMEQVPFDGIVLHLNTGEKRYQDAFNHEVKLTEAEMQSVFDILAAVKWDKFTDNFVAIYAGQKHLGDKSKVRMDWFNDQHWENILHNITLMTKAAVVAKCKGLMFDPEGYTRNMWNYDPTYGGARAGAEHRARISYREYCAQVRKRGAQYMSAIQSVMPDVRILSLYHPPRIGTTPLGVKHYSMHYPFLNGMLDAAGPDVILIDGNEFAYSSKSKADFEAGYVDIKQRKLALIVPENRRKYMSQVQAGQALYMDEIFGINLRKQWTGTYLSYENRLKLFEQVLYHSLDTADEYVWVYSERMSWWLEDRCPEGAPVAMKKVKRKVDSLGIEKRDPGFSIDGAIEAAKKRKDEELAKTERSRYGTPLITPKTAAIRRMGPGHNPPLIDGELNEKVWEHATKLDGFTHHLFYTRHTVSAPVTARILWDVQGLYLSYECTEPLIQQILQNADRMRSPNRLILLFSNDEAVDLHYRLDIDMNKAVHLKTMKGEGGWNSVQSSSGGVRTGLSTGPRSWTAEWFIPWHTIGGKPEPEAQRRANIIRVRTPQYELTNWTPMIDPNLGDIEHLGIWTFQQ